MTDKKRGRPKGSTNKPKTFTSLQELGKAMEEGMKEAGLVAEVDFKPTTPESFDSKKIDKPINDEYNPFSNPLFNKKMGIKDK